MKLRCKILENKKGEKEKEKKRSSCAFICLKNRATQKRIYDSDLGADYRNVPTLISLAFDLFSRDYESMRIGLRLERQK